MLKGAERLADWEKERLNRLFYCYPELKKAWVLKESFRAWYRETDRMRAEERLGLLEERIKGDSLPEFKELLHTLTNWREEILNYFDYRITNGFVEGKNNRIKTIKRMAYGYRNMDNFRMRILAANPKATEVSGCFQLPLFTLKSVEPSMIARSRGYRETERNIVLSSSSE